MIMSGFKLFRFLNRYERCVNQNKHLYQISIIQRPRTASNYGRMIIFCCIDKPVINAIYNFECKQLKCTYV